MDDKHKNASSEVLPFTGERFVPEVHGNIELEHLHRYRQACQIAGGKEVLDIASGEGYGSAMLATRASKVIGVDISIEAVKHALKRYKNDNLGYVVGNCADIPLADASVDMVVSFETIEHHDQHEKMMQEFKRVLRPSGVLLISSPDKYHYSVETGYSNQYHIKELYQHEFKQLLGNYFKNVAYFGQRVVYGSGIFAESLPTPFLSYWQENEVAREAPGIVKPHYWIALASNAQLPKVAGGVLEQPIKDSEIIQSWGRVVAERDRQISTLSQAATEYDVQVTGLNQAITELHGRVTNLNQVVSERDRAVEEVDRLKQERDRLVEEVAQRHAKIRAELERSAAEREELALSIAAKDREIVELKHSESYRVGLVCTWPLRRLYTIVRSLFAKRENIGRVGLKTQLQMIRELWYRKAYHAQPLRTLLTTGSEYLGSQSADESVRWVSSVSIDGVQKEALFMHPPARVSCRLAVPPRSLFRTHIALMPEVWGRNPGGVVFSVSVSAKGNGRTLNFKKTIHPTRRLRHRRWIKFQLRLQRYTGREVEIILSTTIPQNASADNAWSVWGDPRVLARKGFHDILAQCIYHVKLYGIRGFMKRLRSAAIQSAEVSVWAPAGGIVKPSLLPSPTSFESSGFRQLLEHAWKAKLQLFLGNPVSKLVFPLFENPVVSIVIPTFNKAEYLYQCLESILSHTTVPFQLIIVDDCSTDSTPELLRKVVNAEIVKNDRNLEFIKSCNKGASFATGRYILLLNNDVLVTPQWLSILVRTIEEYPKCGAVGVKLIRPDGRLQEAGSIIWADGSALGYGRNEDPLKPEYCYLREVDYCSAACLLVRTELFQTLGGFDQRYLPAYYEDSDLCMGIKSLGYKIVFQPLVSIIHYEFSSRSFERAKLLMEGNQVKFREKWKDALSDHLPHGDILRARDRRTGRRVLVMDDQIPAVHLGSGFPRAHRLLEFLCDLGLVVTFLPLGNMSAHEPTTNRLQQLGVEVFYRNDLNPDEVLRARAGYYDVVIVSRPHNGARYLGGVRKLFPDALLVYDAEALFSLRECLRAELEGQRLKEREKRRLLKNEVDITAQADVVITVSEAERGIVLSEADHPNVVVWGHAHELHRPSVAYSERKDILFVGGFAGGHPPNCDAVIHFVKDCFPRIRQKLTGCKFIVVGSEPPEYIQKLACEDVIIIGFVANLAEYYEKCRVFVAPLRFGAGVNYKVTEAMSYGIPSIVSPIAAMGLGLQEQDDAVLIGEDDDDLIKKLVELYENEGLWLKVQQESQEYVSRRCCPETMKRTLANILGLGEQGAPKKIAGNKSQLTALQGSQGNCSVTGELWSSVAEDKAASDNWKLLSWDAHPSTLSYISRRISGNPDETWLRFVQRRFCPHRLARGLSLGCGWGQLERDAIGLGICETFDAYDVAQGAIEVASNEAKKLGLEDRLRYFCADLNEVVFERGKYDICFAGASLHHIDNLEHLLQQVKAGLCPGGLFIVNEYTGPSRYQWSEKVNVLMNRLLAAVPQHLRISLRDGVTLKGAVQRPLPEDVIRVDPSEAIRSGEIIGLLEGNFEIMYRADFGGTLLQFALADIIGNFKPDDPCHNGLLNLAILIEESLIEGKAVPSDFTFLVCRSM
jgi:GT2 family glycosyltransferase/SAM-dependent methyltransferase